MATSKPGYGAVPPISHLPPYVGTQGSSGTFLTSSSNGTAWSVSSNITSEAITIRNKNGESMLTFHNDGTIETAGGKIHADEWVQITMIMKQFIMEVAKDEESAKKYPYIKDMAHGWIMNELRK
jgi:hypothetical protein